VVTDVDVDAALRERLPDLFDRERTPAARDAALRQRPEFYQLVAEFKRRLPTLDVE
jgi:hypothetical protein